MGDHAGAGKMYLPDQLALAGAAAAGLHGRPSTRPALAGPAGHVLATCRKLRFRARPAKAGRQPLRGSDRMQGPDHAGSTNAGKLG